MTDDQQMPAPQPAPSPEPAPSPTPTPIGPLLTHGMDKTDVAVTLQDGAIERKQG